MRMYWRLWSKHQIPMRAAALTYTLILSIVPLLAVCLSVLSLVFDVKKMSGDFKIFLFKHLAPGTGGLIGNTIDNFLGKVQFKTMGYIGFAALLITALLLLASIEDSINRIWNIQRRKAWWKRVLVYNLILLLGPVSVSLSVATTTIVTKFFPDLLLKANSGVILINTLFLTLIYKIFPNKRVYWWAAFTTGFIVALASEIAKWSYALYTAKTLFYNKVYGGLAALPLFLIWIYANWMIFLSGALLTFMLQHYQNLKTMGRPS